MYIIFIIDMSATNQKLNSQMSKVFAPDHKSYAEGILVTNAQSKTNLAYQEFMKAQKEGFDQFREWFNRFNALS